jgi:hypothetical protein
MFGIRQLELDPEDRGLVSQDVDMGWYSFWTIISIISMGWLIFWFIMAFIAFPYAPMMFFGIVMVFIIVGLAASCGSFLINHAIHRSKKKIYNQKLIKATEVKIFKFLNANAGNAYSEDALLTRLEKSLQNDYFKKFIKKKGKFIIQSMVTKGFIHTVNKDQVTHYFSKPL